MTVDGVVDGVVDAVDRHKEVATSVFFNSKHTKCERTEPLSRYPAHAN
jgi:hypothetical protein